jgi:CRP/FNR family transcriptional regulator, cyclic AMP receptor protein
MRHETRPLVTGLPAVLSEAFPRTRPETLKALTSVATVRTFRPNQAIVTQGEDTALAMALDGWVALRRTTPDGRQLIVRIVHRGRLSTMLPLTSRPAGADAVALTETSVALWSGDEVRALAESDAGLAVELLDQVLMALEEVTARLEGMLYQDALRRVARVLHQHADLFFSDAPVLTRRHLPMLVGTSREMTGRVIRILESSGVVLRVGRYFRLLDPEGLAAAAEPDDDRGRSVDGDRFGPASGPREARGA